MPQERELRRAGPQNRCPRVGDLGGILAGNIEGNSRHVFRLRTVKSFTPSDPGTVGRMTGRIQEPLKALGVFF